jgi:predicted ester cyclase
MCEIGAKMSDLNINKQLVRDFINKVWHGQNLAVLADFWTTDCINHAMPGIENQGIALLTAYHQPFFAAFANLKVEIIQQIAEDDRVMTYMLSEADHSGEFFGIPPTGKHISTVAIRIDRIQNGKIAEHWSVSDISSLIQQLQA